MTNYNNGNWHGWNGGECPVHPESEVQWVHQSHYGSTDMAGDLTWKLGRTGIVAFRVTKPYLEPKKPREWFALVNKYGDIVETAKEVDELDQYACEVECIVVREVV